MQLNTFLSIALLVFTASARPSLREICSNAEIISEKSFTASSNREIKIVTKSCPGLAALRNTTTPSTVRRRQSPVLQCVSAPTCSGFVCDTTVEQPNVADCDNLAIGLIDLNETVAVPPQTVIQASLGTCLYQYGVLDTVTYDVCTSTFGLLGQGVVTDCFVHQQPTTVVTAGFCLSPEVPGNDYIVESSFF